jgi:hypothetical protein
LGAGIVTGVVRLPYRLFDVGHNSMLKTKFHAPLKSRARSR